MGEKLTASELHSYALVGARAKLAAIDEERDRLLSQFPELEDEDEDEERLPRILYSDKPRNGKSKAKTSNGHSKPKKKSGPKPGSIVNRTTDPNSQSVTLAFVNSRTETTIADVAKRFNLSTGAANMRLSKLFNDGKVTRPAPGTYAPMKES